jgi:hypothetical protein
MRKNEKTYPNLVCVNCELSGVLLLTAVTIKRERVEFLPEYARKLSPRVLIVIGQLYNNSQS